MNHDAERFLQALRDLNDAVNNPGPHPRYHEEIVSKHREEFPVLWEAIDRVTAFPSWNLKEILCGE